MLFSSTELELKMVNRQQSSACEKRLRTSRHNRISYFAILLGCVAIGCAPTSKEAESRHRLSEMGVVFEETRRAVPFANIPAADDGDLLVTIPFNDGSGLKNAWGDKEVQKMIRDLKNIKNIDYLVLRVTPISDASMDDIATLQTLRHLNLSSTQVTDEGIARLHSLSRLDGLYAENSEQITGRSLESLKSLPLRKLSLRATAATDESLVVLSAFTTLEHLDLGLNQGVGDGTLTVVAKLPNLRTLLVDGTVITDTGLSEILQCQRLERLGLELCTKVQDAVIIRQLCRLPNIRRLSLSGTGIEKLTIDEIRLEFPRVMIDWSFGK